MTFYKTLCICLLTTLSYAQYDVTTVGNAETWNNSGLWIVDKGTSKEIKGSHYLLKTWYSKGYLTNNEGKTISILGLNYDTKSDAFVVKVDIDSIFMFNDSQIKEVKLENKLFRKYKNVIHNKSSYLEVLAYSKNIEILKYHGKKLRYGKKDPLTQVSKPDKYIDVKRIYFKKDNSIKEMKLSKKQFLKFFDSKSKAINNFISKNKISLKDERNLQKILNYYNTL